MISQTPRPAPADPVSYPKETRGLNFFETDVNLRRLLDRLDPAMLQRNETRLKDFGGFVGGELDAQASYSDRYAPPILETHNKAGEKKSRIVFNPQYEKCHAAAYQYGTIGHAFREKNPEPHLLSFTMVYMLAQADISVHCPVTKTGAGGVRALALCARGRAR